MKIILNPPKEPGQAWSYVVNYAHNFSIKLVQHPEGIIELDVEYAPASVHPPAPTYPPGARFKQGEARRRANLPKAKTSVVEATPTPPQQRVCSGCGSLLLKDEGDTCDVCTIFSREGHNEKPKQERYCVNCENVLFSSEETYCKTCQPIGDKPDV